MTTQKRPLSLPDLPPFDAERAMTLRQAARLVAPKPGHALNCKQLQRWSSRGVLLLAGGPRYLFPTLKTAKERLTTPEWVQAWNTFVKRVQAEDARRQLAMAG